MDSKRAGELISQNLTALYGFAFARLFDKGKVDELVSDIIYDIMVSAKNIKNEDAFWGFAWRIAERTYRRFLRKSKALEGEYNDISDGVYEESPAEEYILREEENEQIYLLRRELSLLSKTHREVCVAYYLDNKCCSQIAKEQNISVEMVKYHLFKTRKLLKEGIGMTRTLGEKSYKPGTFRLNFWGDRNYYDGLFERKLPGSIMLSAYYTPMSAQELSVELGVAMPYLEDELTILENAGLLSKNGRKYQTNLVIITKEYECEFARKTADTHADIADQMYEKTMALLPDIRKIPFYGNDYDDNRLLFAMINIAAICGYGLARGRSPVGKAKKLPLGSYGWLFGHDSDYEANHFRGVCMEVWNKERSAWFSAENYRAIEKAQLFIHSDFDRKTEAMCDAVLENVPPRENETLPYLIEENFVSVQDGKLRANFPVFDLLSYDSVCILLNEVSEIIADCMIRTSDAGEKILSEHVPAAVKDQCADIAKLYHRLDVAALIIESLISKGKLRVPLEKTPLCMFGVKMRNNENT